MMKNIKPNMMEYEVEAYFDFSLKKNGVTDYAFETIAAAGKMLQYYIIVKIIVK